MWLFYQRALDICTYIYIHIYGSLKEKLLNSCGQLFFEIRIESFKVKDNNYFSLQVAAVLLWWSAGYPPHAISLMTSRGRKSPFLQLCKRRSWDLSSLESSLGHYSPLVFTERLDYAAWLKTHQTIPRVMGRVKFLKTQGLCGGGVNTLKIWVQVGRR